MSATIAVDARALTPPITGTGVALGETLAEIARIAPELRWLLLSKGAPRPPRGLEEARIVRAPGPARFAATLWLRFGIADLLARERCDLFLGSLQIAPARRPPRTRVLLHLHDLVFARHPGTLSARNRVLLARFVPASLASADHVLCFSEHTKREATLLYSLPPERLTVVPHGVHPRFFAVSSPGQRARLRARHRLPERYLLFVGTLEPRKNLSSLLEAHDLLPPGLRRDHPLVLIGDSGWGGGAARAALRRRAESGRVIPLGYVADEDLPGLYAAAAALVLPSLYEGFGLPVLEAMAAGTPVVCSDAAALAEVAGGAALLCPPTDVDGLSAAIERVLSDGDLRGELVRCGRERASGFTWERAAVATLDVMRTLLGSGPSEPHPR
ncbi:MAG TPA: glycosyltransferase family 1 protein [Myxococcota bacterium]|nr:glycosyltransferase family 1 protein [Myxococcota bacterium]